MDVLSSDLVVCGDLPDLGTDPLPVLELPNGDVITGTPDPLAWAMLLRAIMVEHEEVRRDYL